MKKRKMRKEQYWQPCPVCGDQKKTLLTNKMKLFKKYSVRCVYCKFTSAAACTKGGARRKWNKATNTATIHEK